MPFGCLCYCFLICNPFTPIITGSSQREWFVHVFSHTYWIEPLQRLSGRWVCAKKSVFNHIHDIFQFCWRRWWRRWWPSWGILDHWRYWRAAESEFGHRVFSLVGSGRKATKFCLPLQTEQWSEERCRGQCWGESEIRSQSDPPPRLLPVPIYNL